MNERENDLYLTAVNDGDLYRGPVLEAINTLAIKKVQYLYNDAEAVKIIIPITKKAAADYTREYPEKKFSPACIKTVAAEMLNHYTEQIDEKADDIRGRNYRNYPQLLKDIEHTTTVLKRNKAHAEKVENELSNIIDQIRPIFKNVPEEMENQYKKTAARLSVVNMALMRSRLRLAFLHHNAQIALLNFHIGTICEVWNKYQGKKNGPKTYEKIKSEIMEKTGCYFWLENRYTSDTTGFTLSPNVYRDRDRITAHTAYVNGTAPVLLSRDNVIQAVEPGMFSPSYINKRYFYDIDSAVVTVLDKYEKAYNAQMALRAACSAYMAFHVDTLPEVSERSTIYQKFSFNGGL